MQRQKGFRISSLQRTLIGITFLLTLISLLYVKTGYTKTAEVIYFGWPFPILYQSYTFGQYDGCVVDSYNSGNFMILGLSGSIVYWYGMSYLMFLLFKTYFPESYSVLHTQGGDRIALSESGWMSRRLYERYPSKDVELTSFDDNKEYSEEYKAYLGEQYMWRGLSHLVYGFFEAAARDFDRVLKLKTPDAESYYHRGYAYSWVDNHKKAIQDYDKAIELDPSNARYLYLRGKNHFLMGNISEARKDLAKALEINPNHKAASIILNQIDRNQET